MTADALRAQRGHAAFPVEHKHADCVFTVEDSQPGTLAAHVRPVRAGRFPP
ncbi:MAG: hypothetical protein ACRDZ4_23505 [Egibacteraceae bacterium]